MRHTHMERKQTTAWPWVAGLALVALIIWGVTSLLAAPREEEEQPVGPVVEEAVEPVAIPRPPLPVTGRPQTRDVRELAPLDVEDVGQVAQAHGEVVATGTTGFWILAGQEVIRVDSDRVVRKGQEVTVEGTIEADDGGRTERIVSEVLSRSDTAQDWRVVRNVKVVEPPQSTDEEAV